MSTLQHISSESDTKKEKITNFFQTHSASSSKTCIESTSSAVVNTSPSTEHKSPLKISEEYRDDQESTLVSALCPVCNQAIPAENIAMNKHIDECLSRTAIEEELSSKQDLSNSKELQVVKKSPTFKRKLNSSPHTGIRSPKRRKVSDTLPKLETFWK